MDAEAILKRLRAQANPANVAGMARYGISSAGTLGVPVKTLRGLAREVGKSHELALALWQSGVHEARILATMIDEPARVTIAQMDSWVRDLDSWDVCDQACHNLFRHTPSAFRQTERWARAKGEFVRRAGFSLIAGLARSAGGGSDARLERLAPLVREGASDPRRMVKKAAQWAGRQMDRREHGGKARGRP